ncbi:hypothetical protein [Granulicella mallensis]|uniref:Uncharacterized protein n=1 Tax=Granulicella mallensis (strain ATCC BAA-1857 / DSM 23137 / MP5ACTX8) TaxID=682795 RepID=G8P001_GRAMM|nr:hypothetical protein [Granulicella mallensis]AEU35717.1 hypothetical protein AciX8_1374 [Granulicella mallensis MP5ACTX8]
MDIPKIRKIVLVLCTAMIAVPLLFSATMYASAWYCRIQAQRLLACVRSLQPGITTEAESHRLLRPVQGHLHWGRRVTSERPFVVTEEYQVANSPSWMNFVFMHTPDPLRGVIGGHLMLDGAMFAVLQEFKSGILSKLYVYETSDGVGHPFSAHATIYGHHATDDVPQWSDRREFNGYLVNSMPLIADTEGRPLARLVLFREDVFVDERGTVEQRRKALDFHLECLTAIRGCHDASLILQPEPNP